MKKLTGKQTEILNFIRDFTLHNKMAPTVYEIADRFGIKTSTVFAHLKALQKKNYLQRSSKARSITLKKSSVKKGFSGVHSIPLQNNTERLSGKPEAKTIFCDAEMLSANQKFIDSGNYYAVIMKENCYLSRGILPGDVAILIKKPSDICPGDLIIAVINDHQELLECKKIFDEQAEFFSFHEKHPIIFPLDNLPIEGKLIGIQRSL